MGKPSKTPRGVAPAVASYSRATPKDRRWQGRRLVPKPTTDQSLSKSAQQAAYRRWKHAHGICVACTAPVSRTNSWYCEPHRQAMLEHGRAYRETHREQLRLRSRLWALTHPKHTPPAPARRCAWCHRWIPQGTPRSWTYHLTCRPAAAAARQAAYQRAHWAAHLRHAREHERRKTR